MVGSLLLFLLVLGVGVASSRWRMEVVIPVESLHGHCRSLEVVLEASLVLLLPLCCSLLVFCMVEHLVLLL